MPEPLKDLFNPTLIESMARHIARTGPFDTGGFIARASDGLEPLELMQRAERIADALEAHLPEDFPTACAMMRDALDPSAVVEDWEAEPESDAGLRGWAILPMGTVVARRGMAQIDLSLDTLRDFTSRFTAEFAVRPFYLADPARTRVHACRWARDPDPHVRRLASEGLRPRLPWGIRLQPLVADPAPILPILETLQDDPSDYVRRSVANSLNDISKDHPDLVAEIVDSWLDGASPEREALLRHAARSLVKAGHSGVLDSFGYGSPALDKAILTLSSDRIRMGDTLVLTLTLKPSGTAPQPALIDFAVHFLRANGSLGPKVFKWTRAVLPPGQETTLVKCQTFREVTTRRHYAGAHRVSVQVNGEVVAQAAFELRM